VDRLADLGQRLKVLKTLKVAVIGGGWAGLAAAVELSAAGATVTVFEAAKQLGGRARRVDIHGHALDNGQHILLGAYRETLRLMNRVGARPERVLKRLPLALRHPAAGFSLELPGLPAPLHLVAGLLSAKGCSVCEKFSAVRFMLALQADHYRLTTDCTVAELLDRHGQSGALRRFMWEPLCLAALNTPADKASAQIFANVLRDSLGGNRADTELLLPTVDLGRIFPDAAAEFVTARGGRIVLSTRVEAIDVSDPVRAEPVEAPSPFDKLRANGLRTTAFQGNTLEVNGESFDHVVLAVAPQHATVLLQRHAETSPVAAQLADYDYEPIATLYARYPSEVTLPCPMLGLESKTPGGLGQWVFDRGALTGMPGVMAFVLSANGVWDERDSESLMLALHGELESALGRKLPAALWHQLIRERRATFTCRPNLPRPTTQTPLRGLWLAGDYVCAGYPATLEGAVRSGVTAARKILESA